MRLHLTKNLVPALHGTGHLQGTLTNDTMANLSSPTKKRRQSMDSSASPAAASRNIKKVYTQILSTVHLQIILMERSEQLVDNLLSMTNRL
jgi:hypothetical protein